MAVMYPRVPLEDDIKSAAERRVFDLLRDHLSDDWEVFHSVGWVVRDHATGADDGEIDFVLVHPERAVICLEVKGGGMECRHGEFYRVIDGARERMKDPFQQALDHRYALQRALEAHERGLGRDLFIVHALALPDVSVHELVLAPDAPHQIVIDRIEWRDAAAAIEAVLAFHEGSRERRRPPGPDGVARIRDLFAPTVTLRVPLSAGFMAEEEALITLTEQQALILSHMGREPRLRVTGCAGSGKTLLAVEQAKRRARQGRQVGVICFNRALRDHLRAREHTEGVHFHTFHGLCTQLAHEAGVPLPIFPRGEAPPEFWSTTLPEALADACAAAGAPFDDLIVDEAQDLTDDFLAALMCTLRDEDAAQVWLFMDANQRVYHADLSVPPEFRLWDLTVNCRNTAAIHEAVMAHYRGELTPVGMGPPGRPVEVIETDDPPRAVAARLERLLGPDEVPPQDVVVLSSHALAKSEVGTHPPAGHSYTPDGAPTGPVIRFASIRGYKGLESPVVLLCELEDLDDDTTRQQLYTGLSRAKNHCIVVRRREA